MTGSLEAKSKFLAMILRHRPESVDLTLDEDGWVDVATLIANCAARQIEYSPGLIREIIASGPERRFELSPDGDKIRATHGHSVGASVEHLRAEPPALLFHGTAPRFLGAIRAEGLTPQQRQHVHLSVTKLMAMDVGARHVASPSDVVVLEVDAAAMAQAGESFYQAASGVWLTAAVPNQYITFPKQG